MLQNRLLMTGAAVVFSLLFGAIFISIAGVSPLEAYADMAGGTVGSAYGLGEVLSKSVPLVIMACGIAVGFYGGQANLGGDGQFYLGALAAGGSALELSGWPWPLVFLASWFFACLAGGVWGALAGALKAYLNTSEIIVTIMLNYVAILLVGFLVQGPLKEKGGFLPQTQELPEVFHLPVFWEGSRVHAGVLVAIAAVIFLWFFINKTAWGYRIRAVGQGMDGARYSGVPTKKYITLTFFLSGAFAGLAGAVEVFGIYHRVLDGISANYGFIAVVIALLGKLNPLGILGSAALLSTLVVGANAMQVSQGIPVSVVLMLQSVIVIFVLWGESFRRQTSG